MSNDLSQTKWRIGIYPGPPEIRMEEEEEPETRTWDYGRTERIDEVAKHNIDELLRQRALIIGSMDIAKLSAEEKFKLLEETRLVIAQLYPARFKTEKVIYSILVYSALVILVLAPLTALGKLPVEVTASAQWWAARSLRLRKSWVKSVRKQPVIRHLRTDFTAA